MEGLYYAQDEPPEILMLAVKEIPKEEYLAEDMIKETNEAI